MLEPLTYEIEGERYPHWVVTRPEEDWPLYESFTAFLDRVWEHLGLPEPTRAQYEIAHRLQYGADSLEWEKLSEEERQVRHKGLREDIIRAFRGLGKSYITAAFVIWLLMRNPKDEKVMVVSASSGKAKQFVDQTKGIIQSMPEIRWLLEGDRQEGATRRDKADEFDVAGASLSQSHSVTARGITGQITGSRATTLIADDIEIESNSKTEEARQRILNVVLSDFVPVTKTEHGKGDIIFLGTPQTEESVYNVLVIEMGFSCFCIPVRYPTADKRKNYVLITEGREEIDILAPYLRYMRDRSEVREGRAIDTRFSDEEMNAIEAKGRSTFALQYMLDTSLSDAERYPLRQHDLIVFECNPTKAPVTIQWGRHSDKINVIKDIPNLGFSGDYLLRPLFVDQEWRDYEQSVLFVDPSGRGKDETSWTILKALNGILYWVHQGAEIADPEKAMVAIAKDAKRFNVNTVEVEPNFGQGMWVSAFNPILGKIWPGGCTVVESEWAKGQKETRIIDTLEPVLATHRLVVSESLLRHDVDKERVYSVLYQLTHITRDRGCLSHDDGVDSLAGAIAHYTRNMMIDADQAVAAMKEDEFMAELEDFIEGCLEGGVRVRSKRREGETLEERATRDVYQS
ncbi:phage terminase large subunit [Roseibium alexandrii]|uniref:Terminase large subunit ribonuclease H-like domain-containing protein n=1 Tax=Roseibium alexandrii (strain DSM 17067 / NCIMB 14079 / DFL-11) TaxID=244592 RepID=A0A5E8GTJ1_ROSAD|nr:phage terminase large subunit [Roseibium alexandrii]EEE42832.1 hypothetical protein SADFL11_PLAS4 [Roseibium alexandrii DFL-11]